MKPLLFITLLLATALSISYSSYTVSTLTNNIYAPPTYPLGNLIKGAVLTVSIQLPNGGSLASFTVKVRNSNNSADAASLTGWSGSSSSATWTVDANASFNLQVSGSSPVMYYLVATINNTITVLRITDLLRSTVSKYFYVPLGEPSTIYASISPTNSSNLITLQ